MCLKTYTKLNGRVGFPLKIIIAILTRVCFMRKLTLNVSNRPIPVLAVPYAKIISSTGNWQQINALSLYCIISCCISIGDCMKSTFSDRECILSTSETSRQKESRFIALALLLSGHLLLCSFSFSQRARIRHITWHRN